MWACCLYCFTAPKTIRRQPLYDGKRCKKCIFFTFLKKTRQKLLSYKIFFITLHYKYKYVLTGII